MDKILTPYDFMALRDYPVPVVDGKPVPEYVEKAREQEERDRRFCFELSLKYSRRLL